jgi:hypothetical protein
VSAIAARVRRLASKEVAIETSQPFGFEESLMRDKLVAARDTLIVLGLQVVFRVALVLRRWNY